MFSSLLKVSKTCVCVALLTGTAAGKPYDEGDVARRQYYVDIAMYSIVPQLGIDSYRGYQSGGAGGPNATLGFTAWDADRRFKVTIKTELLTRNDFVATVQIQPQARDDRTEAIKQVFVLSDLEPRTLEIARNDDGRVYRLNLIPSVKEFPSPKPLNVNDLRLDFLYFQTPVIVNDEDYVGRMSASGQLIWVDVPGLAKVEFSLARFRDAKPLGTLNNGTIEIKHDDGTSLRFSNVTNGVNRQVLEGGPYTVWVRWSEPTLSIELYRESLDKQIEQLRVKLEYDQSDMSPVLMERLEYIRDSGRVMMMSHGSIGPIPAKERIDSE